MTRLQWKLAVFLTFVILIWHYGYSKEWFAFSPTEQLFAESEWAALPTIPKSHSTFVPVTADVEHDQQFVYSSYQPYEKGLLVRVEDAQPVLAKSAGMVLFTGDKRKTGKTMTVAYDTGDTVTYGFLGRFDLLPYTRFEAQTMLGSSSQDLFYIHHENEARALDPESLMMWLTLE